MDYNHNVQSLNNFNYIKTPDAININNYQNSHPSGISYYNFRKWNNQDINPAIARQTYQRMNEYHFKIAHIMGLYYEGMFELVNFPGYDNNQYLNNQYVKYVHEKIYQDYFLVLNIR